jgi:hypothetical protein
MSVSKEEREELFSWADRNLAYPVRVLNDPVPVVTRVYVIAECVDAQGKILTAYHTNRDGYSLTAWEADGVLSHERRRVINGSE